MPPSPPDSITTDEAEDPAMDPTWDWPDFEGGPGMGANAAGTTLKDLELKRASVER